MGTPVVWSTVLLSGKSSLIGCVAALPLCRFAALSGCAPVGRVYIYRKNSNNYYYYYYFYISFLLKGMYLN